ncbi:isoleucine--tRNA ligase [Helicobacter himalayensis]|uniref:isoleucine--tRNA ligase n=1 Tax=Helicobacter himalayensis TaxID=1591088 RepID=UPI003D6E7C0D
MDYKDTLILPNTPFPMRGNLTQNEPKLYAQWQANHLYKDIKARNASAKTSFNLHDGPPYANGHLHIGHALNKILKDMVVKYHFFAGENIAYVPGWDCHGLPIEQKVEEKITKAKKDTLPKTKIRALCREWAGDFVKIQSEEFQALGVLGDFENPYKTMDFAFEAQIYRSLCEIAKKGLLTQRSKPIYWSWACESALADAEVEYQDKVSDSIFVKFDLQENTKSALGIDNAVSAGLVIWTTTPWTLPANVGIAINPNEAYVLCQNGAIVAKSLFERLDSELNLGAIVKEFSAQSLENLKAKNPLNGRDSVIILGEHVSLNDGTGAVHTAPGHGEEDYYIGLKYGLEVIMPVDDKGCFSPLVENLGLLPNAREFIGVQVFKAQPRILELLGANLLKASKITHSYPHCWRSHQPVIYRATTQWFIMMDTSFFEGKTLREIALQELKNVRFYPESGRNRIEGMIQNRPDWCISRQRDWGVPIAFFTDTRDDSVLLEPEVLDFVAQIFEKEGCDAWWEKEVKDLLPPNFAHLAEFLQKGKHILDVWFDSGSTWNAVLQSGNYDAGAYPASMYLEGSDQHRGWFQSSLLLSCAINHKAPYKALLTHGFTMDGNGEKMSKSKGNTIAPQEVLKTHGSEILRLWVAMSDYQNDQRISGEILNQTAEQYKKIRNTLRFLLANTEGLQSLAPLDSALDVAVLKIAEQECQNAIKLFGEYEFAKAFSVLMNFLSTTLSGIYMDLCKDSLYCDSVTSARRLSIQTTMALICKKVLFAIAPTLTYTAYEAFSYASEVIKEGGKDIFSLRNCDIFSQATITKRALDSYNELNFKRLLRVREKFGEVLDSLKKEKKVKNSLELCILSTKQDEFSELKNWLIVSEQGYVSEQGDREVLGKFSIEGAEVGESSNCEFVLTYANGEKCPRCWQFVSSSIEKPCARCESCLESL